MDEVYCVYCGFPLYHSKMGNVPYCYGQVDYFIICENCGKTERLIIDIKRVEPNVSEMYGKSN